MKKPKIKTIKAWVGIIDGKICVGCPVSSKRKNLLKFHDIVRKVEIKVID